MDLHERVAFDALLGQAGEAFVERIVQRCAGQDRAIEALERDPDSEGVWLTDFVDAVFDEWCLADADGAAFVLRALKSRPVPAGPTTAPTTGTPSTIEHLLVSTAKAAFATLLRAKVLESMRRASVYGA
ncbi:hypothetical protein BJY21_001391 [Kineosphaera limosa]|uniref:Uncharacterized protein n=1 Tax=Kineosphaera limosa NBRC 100340 TaxID=1184609 RepID=K6XH10_9MICO|nr:hypothetical protein [Kineosphaera limosa]NYE00207.1 hypothetical protein [Kineosphaera limosa]GAB98134.1 hypothetical protein KILIM_102_00130 [Kineosphaera limosa NBRC 100340]